MAVTQATKASFRGQTGHVYVYDMYPLGTSFNHVPGNYTFAYFNSRGYAVPVYFGQSEDLGGRLTAQHEKLPCARRNGATHVGVHGNKSGERARKGEEADLIRFHRPVCNDQIP